MKTTCFQICKLKSWGHEWKTAVENQNVGYKKKIYFLFRMLHYWSDACHH